MEKNFYTKREISEIMDISYKTLRCYEEKELIKPYYINEENGYKYYDNSQIFLIDLVRFANKKLGIPLREMKKLLGNSNNASLLLQILEKKRAEFFEKNLYIQDVIKNIDASMTAITNKFYINTYTPAIKNVAPANYYYKKCFISRYDSQLHMKVRNIVMTMRKYLDADQLTVMVCCRDHSSADIIKAGVLANQAIQKGLPHGIFYEEIEPSPFLCLYYADYEKNSDNADKILLDYASEHAIELDENRFYSFQSVDLFSDSFDKYSIELKAKIL